MLVFILVSMVSLGSQTQAHIYITDLQTVSLCRIRMENQEILSTPEM